MRDERIEDNGLQTTDNGGVPTVSPREMLFISKLSILVIQEINNLFCSISFGGERILRLSESKEKVFSLPNVSKMPTGNGTQRKAADGPAQLKINCVSLKE
ncbi:MAG: hypothetical protein IKJ98_01645 [Bacteroidales bacterium]|nr:hypothetical protein [Bacteroidales bacterium]